MAADRYERALEAHFAAQEDADYVGSFFDAGFQSAIDDAYEPTDGLTADELLCVAALRQSGDGEDDAEGEGEGEGDGDASSDDEDVWMGEDGRY